MNQAERIFERFGGPRRLVAAMHAAGVRRNPATVYKWTYPKARGGTGGLVPSSAMSDVLKAARNEGIFLTAEDLSPVGGMEEEPMAAGAEVSLAAVEFLRDAEVSLAAAQRKQAIQQLVSEGLPLRVAGPVARAGFCSREGVAVALQTSPNRFAGVEGIDCRKLRCWAGAE